MPFRQTDPITEALIVGGVRRRDAKRLALAGTPMTVPAGSVLCAEGEFGQQAFMLVEGDVVVRLPDGERAVEIGEVFGEIAALNPRVRRNATVVANSPATVLVYDPRTFRALAVDMRELLSPRRAA